MTDQEKLGLQLWRLAKLIQRYAATAKTADELEARVVQMAALKTIEQQEVCAETLLDAYGKRVALERELIDLFGQSIKQVGL